MNTHTKKMIKEDKEEERVKVHPVKPFTLAIQCAAEKNNASSLASFYPCT
jgi:hypothetical protein